MIPPASILAADCEIDENLTDEAVLELAGGKLPSEIKLPLAAPLLVPVGYSKPNIEVKFTFHNSTAEAEKGFRDAYKEDKGRPVTEVGEMDEKSAKAPFYRCSALNRSFVLISTVHNVRVKVVNNFKDLGEAKRLEILNKILTYLDSVAVGAEGSKLAPGKKSHFPTEVRVWTSKDGKTISGKVLSLDVAGKSVVIERSDGAKFSGFPLQNLSLDDQNFLAPYIAPQ